MNGLVFNIKVIVRKDGAEILSKNFNELPIVFGRGESCHLPFPSNNFLSRTHGNISYHKGQLFVQDSDSRNGTLVKGEKINIATPIGKRGQFVAGGLEFLVSLENDPESTNVATQVANQMATQVATNVQPARPIAPVASAAKKSAPLPESLKIIEEPKKKEPAKPQAPQVYEEDLDDYTVVSQRLIKVTRDLRIEDNSDLSKVHPDDLTLQGVVTWGQDIFDVRQFKNNDSIIIGGTQVDPVFVPFMDQKLVLGSVYQNKGYLSIPKSIKWRLNRKGYSFSPSETIENKLSKDTGQTIHVPLILDDLCTLDIGEEVSLHFRYVKVPRPLVARTWIENREEFKKAITISLVLHLVVALIAVFSAPKTVAPKVENVPPRFAKLLVEPPKMILAEPPPPPPEEPKPEPIVEKPPEPPKPEPVVEKPKPPPVVKKKIEPPKPKPIAKPEPKPLLKPEPKPVAKPVAPTPVKPQPVQAVQKPVANPVANPVAKPAPALAPKAPSVEDSFADAFATAAPSPSQKVAAADIKINKQEAKPGLTGGGATKGLSGALKNKVGEMNAGAGGGSGGGLGSAVGAGVGQVGYSKSGAGGQVGKRGVVAAVLGTPKLEAPDIPQGLSQAEVMAVVNKHTAEIHRCYERALFQDNNLVGRVEYEWNISGSGVVTRAQVTRSGVSNGDFLNNCVIAVFKKMKFPASKNGQATVSNIGFPFGKE